VTAVFSEKEKKEVFALKKRLLAYWFTALGVFLAAVIVMIVINCVMIYTSRSRAVHIPFMVTSIVLSVLFSCGSVFFFSIKYKLTSRYCRMLTDMGRGIKERGSGVFIDTDRSITEKNGVYFYSIMLNCPPLKRDDITERKILVERTHSLPAFSPGDRIKFITHANILVAYELDMDGVYENLNSAAASGAAASSTEKRKGNEQ
jgi:hypothetical protein